jgi:cytochrome P450
LVREELVRVKPTLECNARGIDFSGWVADMPLIYRSSMSAMVDCPLHLLTNANSRTGKIVRIGYNQLSFIGVQSYEDIYSHAKKDHEPFLKTELYELPGENERVDDIVGTRDPERHKLVRKTLSHAFSPKALRAQTDIVVHYIDMFMDQITKLGQGEEGINISEVCPCRPYTISQQH